MVTRACAPLAGSRSERSYGDGQECEAAPALRQVHFCVTAVGLGERRALGPGELQKAGSRTKVSHRLRRTWTGLRPTALSGVLGGDGTCGLSTSHPAHRIAFYGAVGWSPLGVSGVPEAGTRRRAECSDGYICIRLYMKPGEIRCEHPNACKT